MSINLTSIHAHLTAGYAQEAIDLLEAEPGAMSPEVQRLRVRAYLAVGRIDDAAAVLTTIPLDVLTADDLVDSLECACRRRHYAVAAGLL